MRVRNTRKFVQWDITTRCNLECVHCRSEAFYGDGDLERDQPLEAIQEKLDGLAAEGVRRIHFLGGEPFTRPDLHKIVAYATDLGILCSVNTNATLISRRRAAQIVEAGTYLITFSIDGCDEQTNDAIRGRGSFAKIIRGVRHVQDAKRAARGRTRLICSHVLMAPNHRKVTVWSTWSIDSSCRT